VSEANNSPDLGEKIWIFHYSHLLPVIPLETKKRTGYFYVVAINEMVKL
jgi:hypothetical protein